MIIIDTIGGSPLLHIQLFDVLLLDRAILGVDVAEDEVQLGVGPALVGAEHDGVGRLVGELPQVEVLVVAQQLDVTATAILEREFHKVNNRKNPQL